MYKESSQHTARFRAGTNLPASTGSDSSSRIAVTKIAHTNRGSLCRVIPGFRILRIVVITFMLTLFFNKDRTIFSAYLIYYDTVFHV